MQNFGENIDKQVTLLKNLFLQICNMADDKILMCAVCGDKTAGNHFGVFACEGCKSFFCRMSNKQNTLRPCRNDNKCVINKKHRTTCKTCRFKKCETAGMSKGNSCFGRRSISFKLNHLLPAMLEALQNTQTEDKNLHETYITIKNLVSESINLKEAITILQSIVEQQKNSAVGVQLNRQLNPVETSSRFVADERKASPRDNVVTSDHPGPDNTLDLLMTLGTISFNLARMQECIQKNYNQSIEQTEPLDLSVQGERHKLRSSSN